MAYSEVDALSGFVSLMEQLPKVLGAFASCPVEFGAALIKPKMPYSFFFHVRGKGGGNSLI